MGFKHDINYCSLSIGVLARVCRVKGNMHFLFQFANNLILLKSIERKECFVISNRTFMSVFPVRVSFRSVRVY